jgi:hypothetical protein
MTMAASGVIDAKDATASPVISSDTDSSSYDGDESLEKSTLGGEKEIFQKCAGFFSPVHSWY